MVRLDRHAAGKQQVNGAHRPPPASRHPPHAVVNLGARAVDGHVYADVADRGDPVGDGPVHEPAVRHEAHRDARLREGLDDRQRELLAQQRLAAGHHRLDDPGCNRVLGDLQPGRVGDVGRPLERVPW
jgi:hypothetical protein